jgi:L-ascorbate metabolism protein UlaG (beta-lactamase superfamily)
VNDGISLTKQTTVFLLAFGDAMKSRIRHLVLPAGILICSVAVFATTFFFAPLRSAPALLVPPPKAHTIELAFKAGTKPRDFTVTRIAHASVLLNFGNAIVLTDPWFSEKMHYHHGEPLAMSIEQLPKLTAIVATHAHYDHFDITTFKRYPDKTVPFFVGPDMVDAARAAGFSNVRELHPWEAASVGPLTITAAPGAHKIPEITYVIQANGSTVYFGGDSKLIPEMRELHRRFPSIQLALLAINGLRVLGEQVVMNAEQAAELAGWLGAEAAVPIHYRFQGSWFTDSFVLGYDGTPQRFLAALERQSPNTRAAVLNPGEVLRMTPCATPVNPTLSNSRCGTP